MKTLNIDWPGGDGQNSNNIDFGIGEGFRHCRQSSSADFRSTTKRVHCRVGAGRIDSPGKAVHYMCVTSMGEVHDHKGHWLSDRKIQFEPYPTSWEGKPATEDVTFNFPDASHIRTRSVITTQDGSEMIFEFHGTRK